MNSSPSFPSWNKKVFFSLHLTSLFLILSLFWIEPLQAVWRHIDVFVFRTLNDYIRDRPLQQVFWATANIKITDLYGALYLLSIFLVFIYEAKGIEKRKRIIALLFTIVWFEITILTCKQIATPICENLHLARHSPTVDLQNYVSLSRVLPWLKVKDSSYFCFPADHGIIVIQWCLLFSFFAGIKKGLVAFLPTLLVIVPRLISGAHWFSDLAVGSMSVIFIAYAWATASPLYYYLYSSLSRLLKIPKKDSHKLVDDTTPTM